MGSEGDFHCLLQHDSPLPGWAAPFHLSARVPPISKMVKLLEHPFELLLCERQHEMGKYFPSPRPLAAFL